MITEQTSSTAPAPDGYDSSERILQRLAAERRLLLERIDAVPADARSRRTGAGRWSVAEIVEHLVRIEMGIARLIEARGHEVPAPGAEPPPAEATTTPRLGARVRDRGERREAPERVRPTGAVSCDDARSQLATTREKLLGAFAAADPAALDHATHPHPMFGPLTLRSWVSLVADHEARHSAQIVEEAAALGGPDGEANGAG